MNATNDQWRRASRQGRREQSAARQPPELVVPLDDLVAERDRLLRALQRLPYGQRAVIVLRYWHQLSEPETAQILENSVGTVKSQASRALTRLREELALDVPITRAEQS